MLPLIATAVALLYLSAVPVHIAVRLKIGSESCFGVGVSAFEPRFALRRSAKPYRFSGSMPSLLRRIDGPDALKSALRSLKFLLQHIRIERIRLTGIVGSRDAALTAMICGCAAGVNRAFRAAVGNRLYISLRPDFSADSLRAELSGMIRVRAGHIILAALLGAFQYGSRRIQKWTDIPSKAS